ncbi:DUF4254 domain-containing protein [Nocardia otitidiscaviarum]|uniref:DUF4254 domain-containing protein n=1 Tax=Nocardia otitidiscaviarum TaxID=1823 RepID=UPI0018951834|nr:DUF4254 domain-containing protein [Nocardia otitidiscaviarum]MBF6237254.1 DUF4254 domain-containing protein [Nocardia otitidiscaviarum]
MLARITLRRTVIPDWHELLAAFCGHIGEQPGTHPVTRCAFALAQLHLVSQGHPQHAGEIDGVRAELIADIDEWVRRNVPRAAQRRGSFGTAVDRMAAAQVHASTVLRTAASASDERVHTAWHRLATLADAWNDRIHGLA